ncbi:MAG: O-antigen ligase family protein [Patescibacteria group bacterium]
MILDRISQDMAGFRQKVILGLFIFLIVIPSFFGGEWSKWLQAAILVSTSLVAFYLIVLIGQQTSQSAGSRSEIFKSPVLYLVIFLLAVAVSVFFSVNHYDSASLIFLLACYVVVFFGAMFFFREWRWINAISHIIFFVGAIAALISLMMFAIQSDNRGSGFLFNANALGSYLLFSLPLGVMISIRYSQQKIRCLYYICTLIIIAAYILTYSYTSWASFILPAIIMLFFFWKSLFTKRVVLVGAALVLVLAGSATLFRYSQSHNWSDAVKIYSTISEQHLASSFNQRLNFNYSAIRMFLDKPLVGFGYNSFQGVYARYALSVLEQPRYAHNYYLQTAAETGVIGGIAFLAFVILLILKTYKKISSEADRGRKYIYFGLWLGICGSAVHAVFDFGWQFPAVFILFWMSGGILLAVKPSSNPGDPSQPVPSTRTALFMPGIKIFLSLLAAVLLLRGVTLFLGVNNFQNGERAAVDGEFEASHRYYMQGWRFDPDPASLVNEVSALGVGYRVLSADQQQELKQKLQVTLWQNPAYYTGYFYLGQMYYADKNEPAALQEYEKAILYNPTFRPDYYYSAALVYFGTKNYEKSKETILNILHTYGKIESSSNPNLSTQLAFLHLLLGQNYQVTGIIEKARAEYQHALRLKSNFSLAEQKLKELP